MTILVLWVPRRDQNGGGLMVVEDVWFYDMQEKDHGEVKWFWELR